MIYHYNEKTWQMRLNSVNTTRRWLEEKMTHEEEEEVFYNQLPSGGLMVGAALGNLAFPSRAEHQKYL